MDGIIRPLRNSQNDFTLALGPVPLSTLETVVIGPGIILMTSVVIGRPFWILDLEH